MKKNNNKSGVSFLKEHKADAVFGGIALFFLILMISLLIYYTGLRSQNKARPEEYGIAMQDLNDIKAQKNELESKISAITRELDELNKKIAALSGN